MLTTLLCLSATWWCIQAAGLLRTARALKRVPDLPIVDRADWPRVSVVLPARNEAEHLHHALRAKLDDGYPNLEVVLVNGPPRHLDEVPRMRFLVPLLAFSLLAAGCKSHEEQLQSAEDQGNILAAKACEAHRRARLSQGSGRNVAVTPLRLLSRPSADPPPRTKGVAPWQAYG